MEDVEPAEQIVRRRDDRRLRRRLGAVEVNPGTAADLDSIKGIGPGTSSRIIKERKKGEFKDWADFISRVKGIGDKNAAKFSASGLTVNGAAYTPSAAAPA